MIFKIIRAFRELRDAVKRETDLRDEAKDFYPTCPNCKTNETVMHYDSDENLWRCFFCDEIFETVDSASRQQTSATDDFKKSGSRDVFNRRD